MPKSVATPSNAAARATSNDRIDKALAWLGSTFTVHTNPASDDRSGGDWLFYYLYGVERVGRLTGERFLVNRNGDKHDWYREGAAMFVRIQDQGSGSWQGAISSKRVS